MVLSTSAFRLVPDQLELAFLCLLLCVGLAKRGKQISQTPTRKRRKRDADGEDKQDSERYRVSGDKDKKGHSQRES